MNVAIVGCGLIGQKRARTLGDHRLLRCADVDRARAEALAARHPGCQAGVDPYAALSDPAVEVVIVGTPHDRLAPLALAAIEAGKHVLVEKPGARSAAELRPLVAAAQRGGVIAKVGYNHRFHPALQKLRALVDEGAVGPLHYVRARYGHGGRLGYEREWRADPRIAGGGELLDQGSHLIDLSRWLLGDFSRATGQLATYFWDMLVEDNAFVQLSTAAGQTAWLHASWTEWKNTFSFELTGRTGKLQVDGLGGSYGTERLTYYQMAPTLGPPFTQAWEWPGDDTSWQAEWDHFAACIAAGTRPLSDLEDALAVLEIVETLYREAGRDYHA